MIASRLAHLRDVHLIRALLLLLLATGAAARDALAQAAVDPMAGDPAGSVRAADTRMPGELITDRPDFTESSEVVGHGVVVLESGFTFEGDVSQGQRSRYIATPGMLVRIGVGTRAELRVSGDGFVTGWTVGRQGSSKRGYSDLEVGAKVKLLDRERLDVAMIPSVSIPTRDRYFSSQSYDPAVKLTWATAVSNHSTLAGNFNLSRLWDGERRYNAEAVSVSLGHDLSSTWGAYGEIFGLTALRGPGAPGGWTANGGVTRAIGRHVQLDVEAGRGLTPEAPDWFAAFGFAIRRGRFSR